MAQHNDTEKFLQAVFGSDFSQYAVLANLNPPAHTRNLREIDPKRDCYWSIAAFPPDAKTNLGSDALSVRALVIDDVGTKVPAGAVELALGRPTAIVETSLGNFQWSYRLSKPVEPADWNGFFVGVEALIGHALEARSAQTLVRLPMGVNTKKDRDGFAVRLCELDPEIELDPSTIPAAPAAVKPALSSDVRKLHDVLTLAELVPNNDDHYDLWAANGSRFKALAPDDEIGRQAFHILSAKSSKYDAAETDRRWGKLRADKTRGGLLLAAAQEADPERFARWEAREVFNDGVEHPRISPGVKAAPHVLASDQFVEGFMSPDYLVNKLITKSFLYSLTGQTGAGKTSITMRLAATVALGRSFGGLRTKPCRVLYLAAENPVDIQMRWIALENEMGFDGTIPVFFIKDGFRIGTSMQKLRAEALRFGDFGLVIVDTGPVFFEGDDENDRVAMRKHARMFRELITVIPGMPAVIVNVHPTKNATADDLRPSGGGSFLNEVDGNLTAAKNEDQTIELGWQGKWRGIEFAPLHFKLKTVTHPRLVDSDGDLMPTIVCEQLSMTEKEDLERKEFADQDKLLDEMARRPHASAVELAIYMDWYYPGGSPAKSKVQRYVKTLIKQKLVKKDRQLWVVAGAVKAKLNGSDRTGPDLTKSAGPKKH